MTGTTNYVAETENILGHSDREIRRLVHQGAILRPITERLLRGAGIGRGMRVLDLGCGAGDVSILAAELVGRSGSVVGIDRSPEAIAFARERVRSAGLRHIDFEEVSVEAFADAEPFDAVIGRYVLIHQTDPATLIRAAASLVRPGGVVAFHELCIRGQCLQSLKSAIANSESAMNEPKPPQQLTQMITGYWISRAIYVAAKLRIADLLADGPRSAEDLAKTAGVAPRPLYRVLSALAGVGVFSQEADGRFRLNPLAEPLREAGPESLRALAVMVGEEQNRCWDDLFETVRTGEPAFDRLYGRPLFAYLGEHPEQGAIFDAAMTGFSSRAMRAMLDAYDLSGVATLADVGGGLGTNLTAALTRYPKMRGLLFDQPHVVERARPRLEAAGVAGRCTSAGTRMSNDRTA